MTQTSTRPLRVDGSMSLLVDMTGAALDPSYAEAAARKAAGGSPRDPAKGPAKRSARLVVALVAAGLVTGIAAAQVRRDAAANAGARAPLEQDVRRQTRDTDALARQAATLREELSALRQSALSRDSRGRAAAQRLAALELATGAVAVHGPGVLVRLDDAAQGSLADPATRGGQVGDGRVYDRDLQDVVNALWLAGAEAMSVNGQRLTADTAIRSAGEAILVDLRPLSPPYLVRAIGNPDLLEPRFADGPTARRLHTLTSLYGVRFSLARAADLSLAAAAAPTSTQSGAGP